MSAGSHLGFDRTRNSTIRSADPEKPYARTKDEVDLMTRCGDIADFFLRMRISAIFLLSAEHF